MRAVGPFRLSAPSGLSPGRAFGARHSMPTDRCPKDSAPPPSVYTGGRAGGCGGGDVMDRLNPLDARFVDAEDEDDCERWLRRLTDSADSQPHIADSHVP